MFFYSHFQKARRELLATITAGAWTYLVIALLLNLVPNPAVWLKWLTGICYFFAVYIAVFWPVPYVLFHKDYADKIKVRSAKALKGYFLTKIDSAAKAFDRRLRKGNPGFDQAVELLREVSLGFTVGFSLEEVRSVVYFWVKSPIRLEYHVKYARPDRGGTIILIWKLPEGRTLFKRFRAW